MGPVHLVSETRSLQLATDAVFEQCVARSIDRGNRLGRQCQGAWSPLQHLHKQDSTSAAEEDCMHAKSAIADPAADILGCKWARMDVE